MLFDPTSLEFHPLPLVDREHSQESCKMVSLKLVFWFTLGRPDTRVRNEEPARLLLPTLPGGWDGWEPPCAEAGVEARGLAREEDVPRSPPTPSAKMPAVALVSPARRLRWECVHGGGPRVTRSRKGTGKGPRGRCAAIAMANCVPGVKCKAADPQQRQSLALSSPGKDFAWWAAWHGDSPVSVLLLVLQDSSWRGGQQGSLCPSVLLMLLVSASFLCVPS